MSTREKQPIQAGDTPLKQLLYDVIFEADTPAGKAFDVALLIAIVASVVLVMLESVVEIRAEWGGTLWASEVALTLLFTIEFVLRLYCVKSPRSYFLSFFGQVDLWSIVPTYLTFLGLGAQALVVIRTLRLLRVFRVLELGNYAEEATALARAIKQTRAKIVVFLVFVMTMVLIIGSAMYLIEKDQEGTAFTNIPRSVYWAIVTMTTVGYGDIAPQTGLGQTVAALAMILGYSVIIVPMTIFSAEVVAARGDRKVPTLRCPACRHQGHDEDAAYCKRCAAKL